MGRGVLLGLGATAGAQLAAAAHARLSTTSPARYDVVVAEGAGSPTEINLRAGDYVNMGLARHGGLPTVVVGDIDRGGVFAAFFGTVALLSPGGPGADRGVRREQVPRATAICCAPGLARAGTRSPAGGSSARCRGTRSLWLDSEDALDLEGRRSARTGARRVAVVRLPRISNFTDVDALGLEPDLDVVFASDPRALSDADLVVLPGTRATIADLAWLRARGLDAAVRGARRRGQAGAGDLRRLPDARPGDPRPDGIEGAPGEVAGLGLLDVETRFAADKVLAAEGWIGRPSATRSTTAGSPR